MALRARTLSAQGLILEEGDLDDGFEIVFEPVPDSDRPKSKAKAAWVPRIRKIKQHPGQSIRCFRLPSMVETNRKVREMKDHVRKIDPKGNWVFNIRKMKDEEGGIGVWATYFGQLTDAEVSQRELARRQRSAESKRRWEKRRIMEELKADMGSSSVVSPFRNRQ